jgi:hypothetical protein
MNKDEALKQLLEAWQTSVYGSESHHKAMLLAMTNMAQARALDKMAENAKELGLDYEPAGGTQVSKVWWDGEKLMAKPIPLEDVYQPAPVQEPHSWYSAEHDEWMTDKTRKEHERLNSYTHKVGGFDLPLYTTPPAAQLPWTGLTDEEWQDFSDRYGLILFGRFKNEIEAKLREKNT